MICLRSFKGKEWWFNIATWQAFINIIPQEEECLEESGVKEGLVLVNTRHI